jgi:hypothetical protein
LFFVECLPGKFGIACAQDCNCSLSCECDAATGVCNNTFGQSTDINYWKNNSKTCKNLFKAKINDRFKNKISILYTLYGGRGMGKFNNISYQTFDLQSSYLV